MRRLTLLQWIGVSVILIGLTLMTILFIKQEMVLGLLVGLVPVTLLVVLTAVNQPLMALFLLYVENYFIMGIQRYVPISGIGVLTDALFALILFSTLLRAVTNGDIEWKTAINAASILLFIWFVYCLLELANPTAITAAWVSTIRSYTLYPLLTIIFASMFFREYKHLKLVVILWSLFTLIAVFKMQIQKTFGFDQAEQQWLQQGDNMRTHILASGIRYFSFFTDAGNYGSNMGCAAVIFSIIGFYTKQKGLKILFFVTALAGLYGLFVSGTRGALAVPFAGVVLLTFLSKRTSIMVGLVVLLVSIFVFFNYTTVGQSNQYIRRMRSAFNVNEPSLVVRLENQKRLAQYINHRPFGEGIGLSGVDARRYDAERLTTNIPNDSWYVKVWVETGIVGLLLYLLIQFSILGCGIWLVLFRLKDRELKGYLTALLCGMFGMMASSYGNAIWSQYPTCILMALSQAFIFLSPIYDKELASINHSNHDTVTTH